MTFCSSITEMTINGLIGRVRNDPFTCLIIPATQLIQSQTSTEDFVKTFNAAFRKSSVPFAVALRQQTVCVIDYIDRFRFH